MENYNEAIELKPDFAEAYNNRGGAYRNKGESDLAIKDYNEAVRLRPDYAEAYNNRGGAYRSKGEFDLAMENYNKAIELKPDYAEACYNRGNVYSEKGEFDLAIKDYNKAIELKPDFAEAYNNRGNAYSEKGEFDIAIKDYNEAIELKPDFAEAYNNRGNAYYRKGNIGVALKDFEKCAILFLTKGFLPDTIHHFIQIFKLIFETESHEILCIECGLIAVFLMDKFEGKISSLEILKTFNYDNLESFLNDIYQQKAHLISPYSRTLLHYLYKTHIDENVKRSEFLSNEDIALVDKIPKEDTRELFEGIKEDREKIILAALLDRMNNPVNGESS